MKRRVGEAAAGPAVAAIPPATAGLGAVAAPPVVDPPPLRPPTAPDTRGVSELVAGFAIALGGQLVYAFVAANISGQEAAALDAFAGPFLHSASSPALDSLMGAITTMGASPVLIPVAGGAVILLLRARRPARALFLLTAVLGSVLLDGILKVVVHRARPVLPWAHVQPDFSFPSGHTMNAVSLYLALALLVWVSLGPRRGLVAAALALALSVAVGLSRINLGYHYLSDVVGGLAAGIGWLFVVALAFEVTPRTTAHMRWMPRRRVRS